MYRESQSYVSNYYVFTLFHNDVAILGPVPNGSQFNLGTSWRLTGADAGPNWRSIIAHGGNATSDMTGFAFDGKIQPASVVFGYEYQHPTAGYERRTELTGVYPFPQSPALPGDMASSLTRADNAALIAFYNKLAAVYTSFKGQVFTGELREALRLIKSPAQSLRQGISDYLNLVMKRGSRLPKTARPSFVRDTWLEYSFGWKPLISDIDDAIGAFYQSQWIKPVFKFVKASSPWINDSGSTTQFENSDSFSVHVYRWNQVHKQSCAVRYYGVYHSVGNGIADLHSYGFSPWEFVPTLWELIPYSFLVDYFTNIGDMVSSWSYRSLGPAWTSKGSIRRSESIIADAHLVPFEGLDPELKTFQTGKLALSTLSAKQVNRVRLAVLSIPSFEIQCPGFGSTKWINILALSKQLDTARGSIRY